MLELCVSIAVAAVLVHWTNTHERGSYVCPSCGSKRHDGHADGCAWKR